MLKINTSLPILFISILIIFFVALPVTGYFCEKREILSHTMERLKTLESNAMRLQEIQTEISRKKDNFTKLDLALLPDPAVPSTIRFVQRLVSESGLSLTSIGTFSTISSSIKSDINETRINFSAVGSYEDFKGFLEIIKNSAKIFELENATISPIIASETEEMPSTPSFSFNITVKTYSY